MNEQHPTEPGGNPAKGWARRLGASARVGLFTLVAAFAGVQVAGAQAITNFSADFDPANWAGGVQNFGCGDSSFGAPSNNGATPLTFLLPSGCAAIGASYTHVGAARGGTAHIDYTTATNSGTPTYSLSGNVVGGASVVFRNGPGSGTGLVQVRTGQRISYSFSKSAGSGEASASLNNFRFFYAPMPPTGATAAAPAPGVTQVNVSWTPPVDVGDDPLSSFEVTAVPGGQTCTAAAGAGDNCTVTGLATGSHTFVVTAFNTYGESADSAPSNAVAVGTPPDDPAAPTLSDRASGSLTVNWVAPNDNGNPITGYTVERTLNSPTSWEPAGGACATPGTATSCIDNTLTPGEFYRFRVLATNAVGSSAFSASSAAEIAATTPAAPAAPSITGRNSGSISISWVAPADGGSPITSYNIERSVNGSGTWSAAGGGCAAPGTATSCTDNTLTPGEFYRFRVRATNAVGPSAFSDQSAVEIAATAPDAPAAPTAVAASGRATISWIAPADGGSPIIGYDVYNTHDTVFQVCANVPETSCTATGLVNGTTYRFQVIAKNAAGNSGWSNQSAPVVPNLANSTSVVAGTDTGSAAVTNETFRVDFIVTGDAPSGTVTIEARTAADAVIASCTGGLASVDATTSDGFCEFGPGTSNGLRASQGVARLVAVYAGDGNNAGSNSANFGFTVAAAQTSTALVSNGPTVFGQPVTLTATLSPQAPGGGPVTGTVRFVRVVGNVTLAEVALVNGVAQHTLASTQAVGTVNYGALLLTNADYEGSNNTLNHTVNKADTSTTVTAVDAAAPGDGIQVNENVTVTVNVAPVAPGAGTPTGTIQVRGDNAFGQAQTAGCDITLPSTSCVLTFSAKGSSTLTATYAGDGSFNGSAGNSAALVVLGIPTTIAIENPLPNPFFGDAFNVHFLVSGGDGGLNGDVTVTATGPAPANTTYTCVEPAPDALCTFAGTLPAGNYTLDASYEGDSTDLPSTAPQRSFTVQKATTAITAVSTTPNPSTAGASVNIGVTLEISNGSGQLGGTINVTAAGLSPSPCVINVPGGSASPFSGSCSSAFNDFGAGQVVTATYSPSDTNNFVGTSNNTHTHEVNRALTTTAITSFAPAAPQVGDNVTVNFDVDGGQGTFEGTIQVRVNAAVVTCDAEGFNTTTGVGFCDMPASLFQAAASYAVQVDFVQAPAGNDASSTGNGNVAVGQRATSTVLVATTPSPQAAGTSIGFTATVSPVGGDFFAGGNAATGSAYVCLSTASPCNAGNALCTVSLSETGGGVASGSCNHTFTVVETRNLVAAYAGNTNFAGSTSAPISYTTDPAPTTIAITSLNPSSIVVGEPVTVNFDVDGGTGTIDGTVNITATLGATTRTCTGAAVNPANGVGNCVFSVPNSRGIEQAGTWSFVADFVPGAGSNEGPSTSAAANLTVTRASTSLVLTSDPSPSTFGGTFSLIATVTAAAPSQGFPTGDVDFFNQDSISIGVVTLSPTATPGVSRAVLSGLTRNAGTYTFRAATITNANFFGSQDLGYNHTVNRADQTITFNQPPDVDYAPGGSFGVSATSDSGLTVSIASSTPGVCTVNAPGTSPATVSIVSGGTCTLVASQAGNANYNAAPTVQRSLTIRRIDQTISFGALPNRPAGAADFTLSATASSGLTVSFASTTTAVCTVSGTTVSYVAPGQCSITASQAGDANYNPAPDVVRSFFYVAISVAPATLANGTVDAAYSVTFTASGGGSTGPYTFAVSVGVLPTGLSLAANGDLTGTPTVAGDFNFTIQATDSSMAPNLGTPYVGSRAYTLTIERAPQTITFGANPGPFTFGGAAGSVTATATSGLDVSFGTSTPTVCSVNAVSGEITINTAGDCVVTADQAGNANYQPAPQATQTVVINRAVQDPLVAAATPSTIAFNDTSALSTTGGSGTGAVSYAVTAGGSFCSVSGSTLTGIGVGTCTVTATKAGDVNYEPRSSTVDVTVIRAEQAPLTAIATPATIAFNATSALSTTGGSGDGAVSFAVTAGGGFCSISGSTLTGIGVGTCTVTATKAQDANYNATSATVNVTVEQAAQTIDFGPNPGPLSVAGPSGSVSATATSGLDVTYGVTPASSSVCSINATTGAITIISAGNCVATADQAGNANYLAAPQATQTVVIEPVQPTLALTSSGSPTSPGQNVTFTATLSGGFSATGDVSFRNGGTPIAGCESVALSGVTAQCSTTALPQGSNPITARYNGDVNNLVALSNELAHVVLTATTTTLSPGNLSELRFGQTATIAYSVSGGVGSNDGNVTVTATPPGAGPVLSCVAPAAAGSCNISGFATTGPAPAAGYTIVASYAGDANDGASTSGSQTVNVIRSNTNTALTFTPPTSSPFGQSFTLTATVTAVAPGSGVPTGTVVFFRDGTSVAEIALNGSGVASFTVPAGQPVGNYVYRAQYGSDTNFLPSFEDRNYAVTAKATTTTVTGSTPNPSELNGLVSFAYTVSTAPGTTPTGNVTVNASTGESCTSTVASGSCSITFNTAGVRNVTATYAGDSQHATSTSAAFSHTVNKANQAALTASATPSTIVFNATSALSTTGGSGTGAVSFAVTTNPGNCSISGSTLTGTGVGTCEVTATKAGDDNYLPASATVTVTVNQAPQAPLTAIATPSTIVFNATSALSTTGGSGTGAVSFAVTANPANCSITGSTLTGTGIGTCEVTASKAGDANYLPTSGTVTVTVNQAPQTITFGANPGPFTFGGAAGSVSATASSGLAVSYGTSSPSVCSVDANTGAITITTAGNCVVTADQAGNANYQAAPQATQTVVINKATQTITFGANPGPFTFGGAAGSVTATASSGLAVSYGTSTGTVCSVNATTGAITIITAGNCVVTADQAGNVNYEPAPQATQTVVINRATQAALTAVATPQTIVFNATSALSTTGGSGTGTVSFAVTTNPGTCSISGSTLTGTAVGTCTVTATKAGDINYEPATATVVVTVNRAPQATLNATATPQTIIEGGTSALATSGGSGTGAVSFAITGGSGGCSISGSTLTGNTVGTCVVTATKAADANYEAATANVTVTVNPATLDLSIVKTGRYAPGNLVIWTLRVDNFGPASGVGSRVIDALPTDVTGATWTCVGSNGGSCSVASGSGNVDTLVDLPNGGRAVFTITATLVNPNAPTVVNTASVQPPAGITDSNMANNNSTLDLQVRLFADGFEGGGTPEVKLAAKAAVQTASVTGALVEATLRGYQPQDVVRYQAAGSELLLQSREIDGLVSVRLLQRDGEGLWTSTRWIELWPGDAAHIDYSSSGGSLKSRLAVGPQEQQ